MPSCGECKAWLYAVETKEWTLDRKGARVPRGNLPTPCESCPRKSPANEAETTLTEQNWKAYGFYLEVRATSGACLTKRQKKDRLLKKLLRTCDMIVRDHELSLLLEASSVAAQLGALRGL